MSGNYLSPIGSHDIAAGIERTLRRRDPDALRKLMRVCQTRLDDAERIGAPVGPVLAASWRRDLERAQRALAELGVVAA